MAIIFFGVKSALSQQFILVIDVNHSIIITFGNEIEPLALDLNIA
jgi:hypothetical protein